MVRQGQSVNHGPWAKTAWLYANQKTAGDQARDEEKRQQFLATLATIAPEDRVDLDESGVDERDDDGDGWCQQGQRWHALKAGWRQGRVKLMATNCRQHLMAPLTGEGSCHRVGFETWLETCLLPVLRLGQVVI